MNVRAIKEFNKHLKTQVNTAKIISQMPKGLKEFFAKTLNKHKFNQEVYVPVEVILKRIEERKELMRNKIFDYELIVRKKKEEIEKYREETVKFSEGFKKYLKTSENTDEADVNDKMSAENKAKYNNRNEDNLTRKIINKNIFSKSFLLENDEGNKYSVLAKNLGIIDIDEDNKFIRTLKNAINRRINKNKLKIKGEISQIMNPRKSLIGSKLNFNKSVDKKHNQCFTLSELKNDINKTENTINSLTFSPIKNIEKTKLTKILFDSNTISKSKNLTKSKKIPKILQKPKLNLNTVFKVPSKNLTEANIKQNKIFRKTTDFGLFYKQKSDSERERGGN